MKKITLEYDPKLKEKFRQGELQREWMEKYGVFDDDDLRLALSQPTYHFAEWYVARIFAEKGCKVLLEKYTCQNHQKKTEALEKLFSKDDIEFIGKLNFPDLLAYDDKEFFFVEVKMDNDKLSKKQLETFKKLRERFDCEILVYEMKEKSA